MLLDAVARNIWMAPRRQRCEYFEDVQDLHHEWKNSPERDISFMSAKLFLETLSLDHPSVYQYILGAST